MKEMYLIGSRALYFMSGEFPVPEGKDFDIICEDPIDVILPEGCFGTPGRIEWHPMSYLNNAEMTEYATRTPNTYEGYRMNIINLTGLAIIKRSHLWRDLNFDKHITHYYKFIRPSMTQGFNDRDLEVLKRRTELTMKAYPQKHPSLKQSKEDFFDDYVVKKYDHDYLHQLVAFSGKPMYTLLTDGSGSVWCSQDAWNGLTYWQQLECVAEETLVIAIERFMVPKDWQYNSKLAYMKALRKVCTTLTSGWFRDFAIDNYPVIRNYYDPVIFDRVRRKLIGD